MGHHPDHPVTSGGQGFQGGGDRVQGGRVEGASRLNRWIVDPLDGTTNFLHAVPHFAVSIALEQAGEIVAGVVYDPIKEELFVAERGNGAFLNDRRIRVSKRTELERSSGSNGWRGCTASSSSTPTGRNRRSRSTIPPMRSNCRPNRAMMPRR